jgi:hypothetical protein
MIMILKNQQSHETKHSKCVIVINDAMYYVKIFYFDVSHSRFLQWPTLNWKTVEVMMESQRIEAQESKFELLLEKFDQLTRVSLANVGSWKRYANSCGRVCFGSHNGYGLRALKQRPAGRVRVNQGLSVQTPFTCGLEIASRPTGH